MLLWARCSGYFITWLTINKLVTVICIVIYYNGSVYMDKICYVYMCISPKTTYLHFGETFKTLWSITKLPLSFYHEVWSWFRLKWNVPCQRQLEHAIVSAGLIKCLVQSKLKLRCSVSQKSVTSCGTAGHQMDFILYSLVRVLLVVQRRCIGEFGPFLFQTSLWVIC